MLFESTNYEIAKIKSSKEDLDLDLHRHSFYELFFFYGGTGTHIIDFEQFDLSKSCLQIVRPHQLHQVLQSVDSEGFVLKINPMIVQSNPMIHRFFNWINYNQKIKRGVLIQAEETNLLYKYCLYLDKQKNHTIYSLLGFVALYISIFKTNQKIKDVQDNDTKSNQFDSFIRLAEANFTSKQPAEYYAQEMHLSLNKLNNMVRERTGMTVKKFLNELLLLEAKRLIVYTHKSVKEIAYELAFLEPPHFSNFFKKNTGTTPSNFRSNFNAI